MQNAGKRVRLLTKAATSARRGTEIVRSLELCLGGPHVIDGEACVLRPDGTSDFIYRPEPGEESCLRERLR